MNSFVIKGLTVYDQLRKRHINQRINSLLYKFLVKIQIKK